MEEPAMPSCINLEERFKEYRLGRDPAYFAEYGPNAYTKDPAYLIIECRSGHIFAWDGDLLAVATNRRGPIAKALAALDCCQVRQEGEDGMTLTFPVESFDEVAPIIKPRRRRPPMSAENKAKLAKASEPYRFKGQPDGSRGPQNDQPRDKRHRGVSEDPDQQPGLSRRRGTREKRAEAGR